MRAFRAAAVALALLPGVAWGQMGPVPGPPYGGPADTLTVLGRVEAQRATDRSINLVDYGAVANAQSCLPTSAVMTAGSGVLAVDSSCAFAPRDVGKAISVQGAASPLAYGPITSVAVTSPGVYASAPTAYFSAPLGPYSTGGADAIPSVTMQAVSATVASGGSGCTNGSAQVATINGGPTGYTPAQFSVTVSGGVVTAVNSVIVPGAYNGVVPQGNLSVSLAGCSVGASLTVLWGVQSVVVIKGGNGYATGITVVSFYLGSPTTPAAAIVTVTPPAASPLVTTIAGYTDAQHVTLATNAATSISGSNVIEWGTDNIPAYNRAVTAATALGSRMLYLPSGGAAYLFNGEMTLPVGFAIQGECFGYFNGPAGLNSTWAVRSTWVQGIDPVHPMIQVSHGSTVHCLQRISAQPLPSSAPSTPWTPIDKPYFLAVRGWGAGIEHVFDLNGARGILYDYGTGVGGGTKTYLTDVYLNDSYTALSMIGVNDELVVNSLHLKSSWYQDNTNFQLWMETNAVGVNAGYWDNGDVTAFECTHLSDCILLSNGAVLSGSYTHSLYAGSWRGVQCNLVRRCIRAVDPSVSTAFEMDGLGMAQDLTNGYSDVMIQLGTDSANARMRGFLISGSGGIVVTLGSGNGPTANGNYGPNNGATMMVDGLDLEGWHNGSPVFNLISGYNTLYLGSRRITRTGNTGPIIALGGGGAAAAYGSVQSTAHQLVAIQLTAPSFSGSGTGNLTPNMTASPSSSSVVQHRISGNVTNNTATATTVVLYASGCQDIYYAFALSASATTSFDSGWLNALGQTHPCSNFGIWQIQSTSGTALTVNQLIYEGR